MTININKAMEDHFNNVVNVIKQYDNTVQVIKASDLLYKIKGHYFDGKFKYIHNGFINHDEYDSCSLYFNAVYNCQPEISPKFYNIHNRWGRETYTQVIPSYRCDRFIEINDNVKTIAKKHYHKYFDEEMKNIVDQYIAAVEAVNARNLAELERQRCIENTKTEASLDLIQFNTEYTVPTLAYTHPESYSASLALNMEKFPNLERLIKLSDSSKFIRLNILKKISEDVFELGICANTGISVDVPKIRYNAENQNYMEVEVNNNSYNTRDVVDLSSEFIRRILLNMLIRHNLKYKSNDYDTLYVKFNTVDDMNNIIKLIENEFSVALLNFYNLLYNDARLPEEFRMKSESAL